MRLESAEEIPESKYDFAPAPGTRTVRQLLTHIALSDSFSAVHKEKRTSFDGVNFPEMVAQMRNAPMWPAMEAVAHTIAYDGETLGDSMSGKPLSRKRWASVSVSVWSWLSPWPPVSASAG